MPITDETIKVIRKEIDRLNRERDEIEEMIKRLEDTLVATTRKAGKAARRVVRPKKAKKARAATKDWNPTGRAAQILRIVKANPGITAAEIAKKAKIKNAASVYPPLNKLKASEMVKKQGKGFIAG